MTATIHPVGDEALLVRFGTAMSSQSHDRVRGLVQSLTENPLPAVSDYTAAYASVLVRFDALQVEEDALREQLEHRVQTLSEVSFHPPRQVSIPVCYGGSDGPDLDDVAKICGLTAEEVITLHSGAAYRVEFIGFAPGFPYLSGLEQQLHVPRREQPRRRVPMGSVAIAGAQTGIYSRSTAGGWQIIGRTPLCLFDPARTEPSLLQFGDEVKFVPISACELEDWQ